MEAITTMLIESMRQRAHPTNGAAADYDPLLERIGDAHFVLVGEGSHGTHEVSRDWTDITSRLIAETAFTAVAVEMDWPDAYRVNRYVRHVHTGMSAADALLDFQRFPTWMRRNLDVLNFLGRSRANNDRLGNDAPCVGFYGLDLYSLLLDINTPAVPGEGRSGGGPAGALSLCLF